MQLSGLVGHGIFMLNPADWRDSPGPQEVFERIETSSGYANRKCAAAALIDVSRRFKTWCGVEIHELTASLKGHCNAGKRITEALEVLRMEKLVEVIPEPRHTGMLASFYNAFSEKIYCPTPELAKLIIEQRL